jgi:hypothetical protein
LNCWPFEREHQKAGFVQLLIFPFHFLEGLVLLLLGTTTTSTHTEIKRQFHCNQSTSSRRKKGKKAPKNAD